MAPYQYQPLDPEKQEIRVLHLHPGAHDDPIRISIEHMPFNNAGYNNGSSSVSSDDLQQWCDSMPANWRADRTPEGRMIFIRYNEYGKVASSSWQPPEPLQQEDFRSSDATSERTNFRQPYDAVSYTWGVADGVFEIEVVDFQSSLLESTTLRISRNLHDMILHLRDPLASRNLWVDFLSINQSDLTERSEQVKKMRDIYASAERVVIWLGASWKDSTLALRTLEYVGKQIELMSVLEYRHLPSPDAVEQRWWQHDYDIPLEPVAVDAILNLVQRPYFERLWIIQEIQLAGPLSIVQSGNETVRWLHVRRAFSKYLTQLARAPQTSFATSQKLGSTRMLSRNLSLEDASWIFRILRCVRAYQ